MNELRIPTEGRVFFYFIGALVAVGVCFSVIGQLTELNGLRAVQDSACDSFVAALATTTSSTITNEALFLSMRRAWRYNYHPPAPRTSKERQAAANLCGPSPGYKKYWKEAAGDGKPLHRSANDEDKTIYETYIKRLNIQNGTYVEVGAFNGLVGSNSRFFDVCLGWDGVLVEANPHPNVYYPLVANRPHAHRFHMAASCNDDDGSATLGFHGTAEPNSAQEDVNSAYKGVKDDNYKMVPCGSLTPLLLDLYPGGHVTVFSLNVEGAEPHVVKTLDFDVLFIELMIVENYDEYCPQEPAECKSRNEYRAIMAAAGYKRLETVVAKSDLFIHPRSQFMKL
jgi:hypothetical protein